jgi:hypothetical protein
MIRVKPAHGDIGMIKNKSDLEKKGYYELKLTGHISVTIFINIIVINGVRRIKAQGSPGTQSAR